MADQKVRVRIEGDDRASRVVDKVQGRFSKFGNFLKSRFVITLGDVTRLVRGLGRAFTGTIDAAKVQEDAIRQLDAALVKMGPAAAGVSKELQAQAAAFQQVTKYGDETIIKGQALIASFTDNAEQIKGATAAALDLAAATGTNLQSAFLLMGRAAAGETSMLSRYGIALGDNIPQSEKFAAALKKIQEQFGGQARAQAETFSGIMAQLGNAFGDLKEKVGEAITKNEGLRKTLSSLVKMLSSEEAVAVVTKLAAGIGAIATASVSAVAAIPNFIAGLKAMGGESKATGVLFTLLRKELALIRWEWEHSVGYIFKVVKGVATLGATLKAEKKAVKEAAIAQAALNARIRGGQDAFAAVLAPANDAKVAFDGVAESARKLTDATTDAATATEELGNALGVVTSLELGAEIDKITASLEKSREELGANSDEYVRLEELAGDKIEKLRERIVSLKDGMGDLKEKTSGSVGAFGEYGNAAEMAAGQVDTLTGSVERSVGALTSQAAAASGGGLFPGLSGASYTRPITQADLAWSGTGYFYKGRRVTVLPDGRIEFTQ